MSPVGAVVFLGVDLGWYGKPSGLASIAISREGLYLRSLTRLDNFDEILLWIETEAGRASAVVAVDAPLVICNPAGIRDAEREMNQEFPASTPGVTPLTWGALLLRTFSRSAAGS